MNNDISSTNWVNSMHLLLPNDDDIEIERQRSEKRESLRSENEPGLPKNDEASNCDGNPER